MRSFCHFLLFSLIIVACGRNPEKKPAVTSENVVKVPTFNADSAFRQIANQVAFGPRVPGSDAHLKTGDYLIKKLKACGGSVAVQSFEADTYDGHHLRLRNVMASFNPGKAKHILLAAHWDTRPFADKDSLKKDALFDGANDGASGTGILLEVARAIQTSPPGVSIDILFFDGEDWGFDGNPEKISLPEGLDSWWCLGSQYWAKHRKNYAAYYGILLDMAGAKNAHFYREGISQKYAPMIVEKVWSAATRIGCSRWFVSQDQSGILDDHVFVNQYANIPMVDIVDYQPGVGYFGDYHHSRKDNMDIISKETLSVVGRVLLDVIYNEH